MIGYYLYFFQDKKGTQQAIEIHFCCGQYASSAQHLRGKLLHRQCKVEIYTYVYIEDKIFIRTDTRIKFSFPIQKADSLMQVEREKGVSSVEKHTHAEKGEL